MNTIDEAIIDGRDSDARALLVMENLRLSNQLRRFVRWFDKYERDLDPDERDSQGFRDLRDMRDAMSAVLMGVSAL